VGITFNNFTIKGFDVSQFQSIIDWNKVASYKPDFVAIRVGHGNTTDTKFLVNWSGAKGKTLRIAYWYMDYYSNHIAGTSAFGMSDAAWGIKQAQNCWNKLKADHDNTIVFLDIENANSTTAAPIATVTSRAQTIARAFLEEMDRLNGKTNGIYASLGMLSWFGYWFRTRPLWVAWYSEMMWSNGVYVPRTGANVLTNVKSKGWTGKCLMWQYASDGDLNDDGIADGIAIGIGSKALDLNGWIETKAEWDLFSNTPAAPTPINMTNVLKAYGLSQLDPVRKDIRFGDTTIEANGCVTVNIEVLLKYLGLNIDTAELVAWLKANGGYSGNLFVWKSIEKLLPGLTFIAKYTGPSLDKIDEALARKMPCLIHVDFDPATYLVEQHWVLVIGKDGESYIILDPRNGNMIRFEDFYGDPTKKIFNVSTYSFTEVPVPLPEPDPIPLPNIPQTSTYEMGKTLVNGQNIRSGPSLSYGTVGSISSGEELPLLSHAKDASNNPWVERVYGK